MKKILKFDKMIFEESKIADNLEKVGVKTSFFDNFTINKLVVDSVLAKKLGKKEGIYVAFNYIPDKVFVEKPLIAKISKTINELVDLTIKSKILLVGLGNYMITADSLGKATLDKLDLTKERKYILEGFSPSVSSITNIESVNIVKGIVLAEKPSLVVVIDSLATDSFSKLCCSFQLSTSGITAGGGVKTSKKVLDKDTLGVPVLAIGVPLIINMNRALGINMYGKSYLCPQEVDIYIDKLASILSKSIDLAFS